MTFATYRCPKCGLEFTAAKKAGELSHLCPNARNRRVVFHVVPNEPKETKK